MGNPRPDLKYQLGPCAAGVVESVEAVLLLMLLVIGEVSPWFLSSSTLALSGGRVPLVIALNPCGESVKGTIGTSLLEAFCGSSAIIFRVVIGGLLSAGFLY